LVSPLPPLPPLPPLLLIPLQLPLPLLLIQLLMLLQGKRVLRVLLKMPQRIQRGWQRLNDRLFFQLKLNSNSNNPISSNRLPY
jgi:hypothetical protein